MDMLIMWGGPLDEIYGTPICKGCGGSLVGEVIQYTIFKCTKCNKEYEMHSKCARLGCPECRGKLILKEKHGGLI